MGSSLAPFKGSTSLYCYLQDSTVLLMKDGYRHVVTSVENFHRMFHQLNGERAALKQDCIEYVVFDEDKEWYEYPRWYVDAMTDGWITQSSWWVGDRYLWSFLLEDGEVIMRSGDVILQNHMGELRYMERNEFEKYYDTIGGL